MSSAAARQVPLSAGGRTRSLDVGGRRERTPLSVVRSVPRKRRTPFVVMCFALLALALVTVLVLNIQVSSAQYSLVQLKSTQSTLTKENQDLTQQVQNFEAPQNLAAKATQLGMVASTAKGQIDVSTLTVTGKATPAAAGASAGAVIPAPAVAGQLNVVPPATAGEPLASRAPAAEAAAGASAAEAGSSQAGQAAAAPAPAPAPPAVELNGGSVPAPEQRTPGQ
ncbi:hypothetical protein V1638_09350 [Pseudarthrobacter sp. J64]|uniref:hypothetical protein n=1 Tax=Pseudarthrobacter sp. J64 TaxID=3116485 RepID=UPI002E8169F2|nr:hypothetical protein [Pseudarthrobacter sp. J64]MEE2569601.1 hypothetical protein [Pseudarthrobacter sp. J64]